MQKPMPLDQQIVAALRKIIRAVDLHSRHLVEACGLTGPQLATLQQVQNLGPSSATAIARAVHLSQGTVTGILARLENRELITRQRSEQDRRSVVIAITPRGQSLLDTAPSLLQDRFRDQLDKLEEWQRLSILATLLQVAGLMGADDLQVAPHLLAGADGLDDETAGQADNVTLD